MRVEVERCEERVVIVARAMHETHLRNSGLDREAVALLTWDMLPAKTQGDWCASAMMAMAMIAEGMSKFAQGLFDQVGGPANLPTADLPFNGRTVYLAIYEDRHIDPVTVVCGSLDDAEAQIRKWSPRSPCWFSSEPRPGSTWIRSWSSDEDGPKMRIERAIVGKDIKLQVTT